MEIKTKFNIGDTAYRIVDNSRLVKEVIHNIDIHVYNSVNVEITYTCESRTTISERLLHKDIDDIIANFKQQDIDINIIKE